MAAKAQVEAEHKQLSPSEKMAMTAAIAENAVNRTQPVWGALHSSGLGNEARNRPLVKLITMFMAQRNQNINILARSLVRYREDPSQWAKAGKDMSLVIGGQTLFIAAIGAMWEWALGGFDDDEDDKTLALWLVGRSIETLVGNVYFGSMAAFWVKEVAQLDSFTPESNPLIGTTKNIMESGAAVLDFSDIGSDKWWKGIEDATTNSFVLSPYGTWVAPYRMISRFYKNKTGNKSLVGGIVGAEDSTKKSSGSTSLR